MRHAGCVHGGPVELKAQLAEIAEYLGTTDPIELGAALLLEQAGCERTQIQLELQFEPGDRPEGADGSGRHAVELTTEGFQVLDTRTNALRADVWGSRGLARHACDELDGAANTAIHGDGGH